MDIFYDNEKVETYIPDLIVSNKILIELKSKQFLSKGNEKQFGGYLKGSKYKL
jgi:GxxExxY protein